ncbi:MAG: ferredoxin oxidoreductase [Sphingobacteriales bacterium 17-39-43]|uniref:2-oxoacid:acceptor oxidoreductase subunit alpha n=1 Tax=Daejeonella sp. TaxID=2805397 RepID=UPI000BC69DEE|nr:2-oxoacid:acceptor oxidoreductase subunit alpha [Daejeonella sp.]OYY05557.1 MAG: ferredoxin oxidoreductase [Sphingobacteriia bacterium 35-40-5]OYZ30666.1 MAG: ferredoxin oxidoreductase [Sphingobacteriales bacterium 16-39-50]OZA23387.1 MAG: ferredoxin oxidoreductase [Sphingobacteriales bacterium 17-39-43]HQS50562.1 2-oxoacid:acceptor oxidoreductase subunit alpha [Daejeonella sp.]HQT23913.1 2-oxoacid:acceptor oxidoreductase subunit alpha [Daejeonella sp.]
MPNSKVNDFVIRFANVNGTGSASANYLFAKAIFRMGIPVTPKNIFPSNIQGLPTWYDVRVSEKGYLGRREGVDLMVCVNPQSMPDDVLSVKSGGYFIYDCTKALNPALIRPDVTYIGLPLMEMCLREFTDPRQRQLFKNIIYVGALSALLDIEFSVLEQLLAEQFVGKEKLVAMNIKALNLGISYIHSNYAYPLDIRLERRDLVGDKILIDGNSACGLGAVYGGATVVAWYPITPSTSVVEAFEIYAKKLRVDKETGKRNYAIVQAEDELAAIGMVIGANWNGARSFTATSGPGLSLMNEFLGLAYFAEIPTVLIDVQRTGPSTGMPTRTQQSDILLAAYASHGDTKQVLVFPSTPKECFEMTAEALDLAESLQTPIIMMTDLDLGMNDHMSEPFHWDDTRKYNRGKILNASQLEDLPRFGRYLDVDGDGITYRTIPGTHPTKGSFFTRGTSRDEYAAYTEDGRVYARNMDRLLKKWNTAKDMVPAPYLYQKENKSAFGLIFFGTSTYSAEEAMETMAATGINFDAMRLRAFPFNQMVEDFIHTHEKVFIIEQNRDGQMRSLLINELNVDPQKMIPILNYDGMPITAHAIMTLINKNLSPALNGATSKILS